MPNRIVLIQVPEHLNRVLVAVYPEQQGDGTFLYVPYPEPSSRRISERKYTYQRDVIATYIDKNKGSLVYARNYDHLDYLRNDEANYQYAGTGKLILANAL